MTACPRLVLFLDNLVVVVGILIECRRLECLKHSFLKRSPKAQIFFSQSVRAGVKEREKIVAFSGPCTSGTEREHGILVVCSFASIRFGWSSSKGRMGDV